ncbi:MAG: 2-dehydropantoate 2-reductase [Anaerolineae bacterium]
MRIAVLGTGALGCLFASRLSRHADVWMLGTWRDSVRAASERGVVVECGDGRRAIVAVQAADDPLAAHGADVALILVKAYQTERAAHWAAQCLHEDGIAITLQNGIGPADRLARILGRARVFAGVTYQGATVLGPAHIRHAGEGPTWLERRSPTPWQLQRFGALCQAAGIEVRWADDIAAVQWQKLIVNAAINPLTALWRVPNGDLLTHPSRRTLLRAVVNEAVEVAGELGQPFELESVLAAVERACQTSAANRSSMLQDVEAGRPTEIDVINGAIVSAGRRIGIATPVNETLCHLVKGMAPDLHDREVADS